MVGLHLSIRHSLNAPVDFSIWRMPISPVWRVVYRIRHSFKWGVIILFHKKCRYFLISQQSHWLNALIQQFLKFCKEITKKYLYFLVLLVKLCCYIFNSSFYFTSIYKNSSKAKIKKVSFGIVASVTMITPSDVTMICSSIFVHLFYR